MKNRNEIPIANPFDYDFGRSPTPLFRFVFGAYGDVQVYAWGCHSLEDALEAAAEWCAENAPGVFSEPDYEDARRELGPEASDEEVQELAETDHTYTESGYLLSYEWWVDDIVDIDEYSDVYNRSIEELEAL